MRPRETTRPLSLEVQLRKLYARLPMPQYPEPPTALDVSLGPGVFDLWDAYNKLLSYDLLLIPEREPRLDGTYGRLPTQALKVATILAALSWPDDVPKPIIEIEHMARAIRVAETWRASAHRALKMAYEIESDVLRNRIYRRIAQAGPSGVSLRDLRNAMRRTALEDIEDVLHEMEKLEEITLVRWQPKGGGRPSERYVSVTD